MGSRRSPVGLWRSLTLSVGIMVAGAGLAASPASAATVSAGAYPEGQAVHAVASASSGPPSPVFGNPYYMASASGAVWPLGGAPDLGSLAGVHLAQPVVGIAMTPDRQGYWLVAADGGVFTFGDAGFYGSLGDIHLNAPIIGMAATPDGHGYWLFASDGGVFTFGDAGFYGSTGDVHLNAPVVGMAPTPDGHGYWLFAADGGMFTFGDAGFYGSTGDVHLDAPIVGMAPTPDGKGYWLVGSDGGIFTFGDAGFYGSLFGTDQPAAEVVAAPGGAGYWIVAHDGDVYPFGSATSSSMPTIGLFHTILGPGDVAMEWAMAQLGKPYQWGATGPASFDCSGLVMKAWQAAGVNIARIAADQYYSGSNVAISDLHIGDLVFWASNTADPTTIYHVAMYIGGDQVVDAPYPGQVVRTDWIGGTGFVGMGTRP